MPKRICDGEGIWKSDKIAQVEPARYRAEYANLLPLALANGSFECNARAIWAACYGYNRPDVTPEDVVAILDEFERVKLLFRWTVVGKTWGFWVGIDKPGRLPSEARQRERHEKTGEIVPQDKLRDFLGEPTGSQPETIGKPIGSLGFGFGVGSGFGPGFGLGNGSGNGSGEGCGEGQTRKNPGEREGNQKPPSNQDQNLSDKRKAEIQEQSQHRQLLSDAIKAYRHTYGKEPDDKAFGIICQKTQMAFDYGKMLLLASGQGR
jgi:hypothetical protein